jgi:hypothetical protein
VEGGLSNTRTFLNTSQMNQMTNTPIQSPNQNFGDNAQQPYGTQQSQPSQQQNFGDNQQSQQPYGQQPYGQQQQYQPQQIVVIQNNSNQQSEDVMAGILGGCLGKYSKTLIFF